MTYLTITEKQTGQTSATMKNVPWNMDIPIQLRGRATSRFYQSADGEKMVRIDPDVVHVFSKGNLIHSMENIRVSRFFNRSAIEGIDVKDGRTPVIVLSDDITLMWSDDQCESKDVWNIELSPLTGEK